MILKKCAPVLYLILFSSSIYAQTDTIKVCTYNLLNYGNAANPYKKKDSLLKPILQAINPQIAGFNEISTALPALYDTLEADFPIAVVRGPVHNTNSQTQLNALYWQQGKFHLLKDTSICHNLRDIVAYNLYYDYPGLATFRDTTRLTVIVAHLKASNTAQDRADRAAEASAVAAYLSSLNQPANYILMGDLNIYTSNEAAYQNLINPINLLARLNDPINRLGNWNASAAFADVATQSLRSAALPDGGASGGLDSRFDFILVSDPILNGSKGIRYIPGSYSAYGNDGQHYNKALIDLPANSSVAQSMAQRLYDLSDHLPVVASFAFTPLHLMPNSITEVTEVDEGIRSIAAVNPFGSTIQLIRPTEQMGKAIGYRLISIEGKVIEEGLLMPGELKITLRAEVAGGLYFLQLRDEAGRTAFLKLVHR
jgi:hypothetical protein